MRHGVAHVWTDVDVVDVQHRNIGDARVDQLLCCDRRSVAVFVILQRQLVTGFDINRTGFFVDDVLGDKFATMCIERNQQILSLHRRRSAFFTARGVTFLAGFGNDFARFGVNQIICWTGAAHTLGEERGDPAFALLQLY